MLPCRVWDILTQSFFFPGLGDPFLPLIWLFHFVIMTFSPMSSHMLPQSWVLSPVFKRSPICSYLPIHCLIHCYNLENYSTLFLVSCRWWGIHHCPPSIGHFLSTSAYYPGRWLRNSLLVPQSWHALMVSSSHPMTGLHYWLLIEWFHECSTSTSLFHLRIVLLYLEGHSYYWWFLSYLLTVHIISLLISWFSSMFDFNTFLCMLGFIHWSDRDGVQDPGFFLL